MIDRALFRRLKDSAAVWDAGQPGQWFPFELLDTEACPFYIGWNVDDVLRARGERDRSRMVTSLSMGGSDLTDEGYYFYGPALSAAGYGGVYGELHGLYAVLAENAVYPGDVA